MHGRTSDPAQMQVWGSQQPRACPHTSGQGGGQASRLGSALPALTNRRRQLLRLAARTMLLSEEQDLEMVVGWSAEWLILQLPARSLAWVVTASPEDGTLPLHPCPSPAPARPTDLTSPAPLSPSESPGMGASPFPWQVPLWDGSSHLPRSWSWQQSTEALVHTS